MQIQIGKGLKWGTAFCLGILLAGCQNAVFEPALKPDGSQAVVHLFRPAATSPGLAKPLVFAYPEVFVDGQSVGVVKYKEYISFHVKPGKHSIRITGLTAGARDWDLRDIKQDFRVEANEVFYYRLKVEFDVTEMGLLRPAPKYRYFLTPVGEEDAQYEIREISPGN